MQITVFRMIDGKPVFGVHELPGVPDTGPLPCECCGFDLAQWGVGPRFLLSGDQLVCQACPEVAGPPCPHPPADD